MRLLFLAVFLIVNLLGAKHCNAQTGTFIWTNGAPTTNPGASGARFAVDRATFRWYEWVSGTTWVGSGDRIQSITGCSAPNYTPAIHQSWVVINNCDPNPELYAWNGAAWKLVEGGGGGSQSLVSVQDSASFRSFSASAEVVVLRDVNRGGLFRQCTDCSADQYMVFTDAINRKWERFGYDEISIKFFGADTSSNNNSAAIERAFAYTKKIKIPKGRWITASSINLRTGQSMVGESRDSSIIEYHGSDFAVRFTEDSERDIEISNLRIRGKFGVIDTSVLGGIYLRNTLYSKISFVFVDGQGGGSFKDGIKIEGVSPYNVFGVTMSDVKVQGCRNWALHLTGNYTGTNIVSNNCQFEQSGNGYNENNGNVFMECSDPFVPWGPVSFNNCIFQGTGGYPFICEGAIQLELNSCYWEQYSPSTRPPINLGRAPWRSGLSGTSVNNMVISQPLIGIDTIATGFGIVNIADNCYVRGTISKANVTAPNINGAPFVRLNSSARLELLENIIISPSPVYIISGSTTSDAICEIKNTSPSETLRIKSTNEAIPIGESIINGQTIKRSITDNSYNVGATAKYTETKNIFNQDVATIDAENGLRIKSASVGRIFSDRPQLEYFGGLNYTGQASFTLYDFATEYLRFGQGDRVDANRLGYPTFISNTGFNKPALTLKNLYTTINTKIFNVTNEDNTTLSCIDTAGTVYARGLVIRPNSSQYDFVNSTGNDVDVLGNIKTQGSIVTGRWTTATRPTPAENTNPIGFNTTTGKHEGWDGTTWNAFY